MDKNEVLEMLHKNYDFLSDNEIYNGKELKDEAILCMKHYLDVHKKDKYNYASLFDDTLNFLVYCSDWEHTPEVKKVKDWLDNYEGCDLYAITADQDMFGEHDITLFMPEHLRKLSIEHDYSKRWKNDEWQNCVAFHIYGELANIIKTNLLTNEQVIAKIKKEIEK